MKVLLATYNYQKLLRYICNLVTMGVSIYVRSPASDFYHRGGKKNFSRAAEVLNISQPAISQNIHALEDYYGAKLFERSSKKVDLTQAGETLFAYAKEILDLHRIAKRAVSDLVELVTGNLNIGASFTVGEYVLPKILAAFTHKFPDVKFSVSIGNTEYVHESAREDSIDIGLVEGEVGDPQLEINKFLDDELIFIVSKNHPLAGVSIRPEDFAARIKDMPFIIREEGSGTRLAVEKALEEMNFRPSNLITLGSTQAIKESVEANLGISMLSKWTLRKEIKLGSIKPIRCCSPIRRGFYLIQHHEKFQSRASAEFKKFIIESELTSILS